jgi:hypothetical protein
MAEKSQVVAGPPLSSATAERRAAAIAGADGSRAVSAPSPWLPLASLLELSRELSHLLVLVQPRPEFRAELYRRLLAEARRQQAMRLLSLQPNGAGMSPDAPAFASEEQFAMMHRVQVDYGTANKRWIIGAAAVGSASLLGLLVYVRSRRHGRAVY